MFKTMSFAWLIQVSGMLVHSYEFKNRSRKEPRNFTRDRKIGFVNTIMALLNFNKKSSQAELDGFFENVTQSGETVSRQSFDEARNNVLHTAFAELFEVTALEALKIEDATLFKGYRVMATDGSTLMLEKSKDLQKHFGPSTPSDGDVFARISVMYDILNDFIVTAEIKPFSTGERTLAKMHIAQAERLGVSNALMLYDRGYWSSEMVSMLCGGGHKFVMRLASNACKKVTENSNCSGEFSVVYQGEKHRLRYYKFILSSGEQEILATNLTTAEFADEELSSLYNMRWGVETKYKELKSRLKLESFTGKSVLFVLQDFYATLYLSNMISFAHYRTDEMIKAKNKGKNLKYEYKSNQNLSIGILKNRLIIAIITPNDKLRDKLLANIFQQISRYSIPIRPNRSTPRRESSIKYKNRMCNKSSL